MNQSNTSMFPRNRERAVLSEESKVVLSSLLPSETSKISRNQTIDKGSKELLTAIQSMTEALLKKEKEIK